MKRTGWFAAQLGITVILLALLFRSFEWGHFWAILAGLPSWYYVLSFLTVLAGQVLYAFRWRLLMEALRVPVPFGLVLKQYFLGTFFNNFMPSTMGGDWIKVYYLGRTEGYVRIGASILVDRLIGVFILASMAVVLTWRLSVSHPAVTAVRSVLTLVWLGLAVVVGGAALVPLDAWLERFSRGRPRRLELFVDRVRRLARHIHEAAAQPSVLAGSSLAVVLYLVLLGFVYQEFLVLVTGSSPGFLTVMALVSTITTLSNLPIAVNGLGLREQLHLAMFAPFGLSKEAAAGISLLLFGHLLCMSASGAVFWLMGPAANPARMGDAAVPVGEGESTRG